MVDSVLTVPGGNFDVVSVLNFIFGSNSSDIMFLKIGLWLVLFAVMFKALEKVLSTTRGQAGILSFVISVLAIHFMPNEWLQMLGTFIWIVAFVVVPYFFISALTQPGLLRWIIVVAAYLGLMYSLANVSSLAISPEIAAVVDPVIDALSPVLYLVGDLLRLNSEQYVYILVGVIVLVVVLALFRKKEGAEEGEVSGHEAPSGKDGGESWLKKFLFGSGKAVGKSAWGAGKFAAKGTWKAGKAVSKEAAEQAEKAKELMKEDALRTKRLWSNKCMYCGAPLVRGKTSCPNCGKGYVWRQRRWAKAQEEEERKIDRMWRT